MVKAFDTSKVEPSAMVDLRLAKRAFRYPPSNCVFLLWIMLPPSLRATAPTRARIWRSVLAVEVVDSWMLVGGSLV